MNYYVVAPLTHLANTSGLLTYSHPDKLEVGALVNVPLRNSSKKAIVISETTLPKFRTKPIDRVISSSPVISKIGMDTAQFISDNYFCTFGEAIGSMLPVTFGKKRRLIATKESKNIKLEKRLNLTMEQKKVLDSIKIQGIKNPHLLFGVTGSGKTEIYLQLISEVLKSGKSAIILVPEIALTPQTISRFTKRFGNDSIALLHSGMKETEKFYQWQSINNGNKKIVIGPRSALFAPLNNLGIIIIDEAHETTYKQNNTPRYQAIKVAEFIAQKNNAYLILGTATPTIEQFHSAKINRYNLHILSNRITQNRMPKVDIVDMRNEFRYKNKSIFSERLQQEIKETLKNNKQVLLFLNRRGMSTFVSCRSCGYIEKCPNCDIPLTFHYEDLKLRCHHCDYCKLAPASCPQCQSMAIKYFGTGTEKIEQEIKKIFGNNTTVIRMDSDTTKTRESHNQIFEKIKNNKASIVIGTQMVAKGWDIENIDLIGVISADSLVNLPDYQAEERALSLLLQVAGRAGRGNNRGKVIIQTYNPNLKIFKYLKEYDYQGFYKNEILNREQFNYPPFAKMIDLLYNNTSDIDAKDIATVVYKKLTKSLKENDIKCQIIGPSPSFIHKKRGKYNWQITLKLLDQSNEMINDLYKIIAQIITKEWTVDVDPNGI